MEFETMKRWRWVVRLGGVRAGAKRRCRRARRVEVVEADKLHPVGER